MRLFPACALPALFLLVLCSTLVVAEEPLLKSLRPRPRLLFTTERQAEIEAMAETDQLLALLIDANVRLADAALKEKPCWYEIPDGKRLLAQSRRAISRVWAFAFAYRMTGEVKYKDAAIREMLTVCKFKDWNPRHFLDTAEMTAAVAVGYDWLYDEITPDDRKTIREAIVQHGFEPGLTFYERQRGWVKGDNNWNQVCNGGLLLGALAIGDEDSNISEKITKHALASIPCGLSAYRPDGAYPEGPTYWAYGTIYTALTIDALDTALGCDFDIPTSPGLDKTGAYRIHTIGPFGDYFNYADCGSTARPTPTMFCLARVYDKPMHAWWHRQFLEASASRLRGRRPFLSRFQAMEVAWYDPRGTQPNATELPRAAVFRGRQDIATMRTAWGDPDAVYVGIKGGNNRVNHCHLDLGSFVLDAGGVRWAMDLGSDNYNMPGYFGGKRWTYYRMTNRSHNTLVIGDKLQNTAGVAPITEFSSEKGRTKVVIDLTPAYKDQVTKATRTATLYDDGRFVVEDVLRCVQEPVRWGMVTAADVKLDGRRALLTRKAKTLEAKLSTGTDGAWEIVSTKPPQEIEKQNTGTRMLATTVAPGNGNLTITVELKLVDSN